MTLAIQVLVAGEQWTRVEAPADLAARDWLLGVVAVQAFYVPGQGLSARVRASRTGMVEAQERPLSASEPVLIELVEDGAAPTRWSRIFASQSAGAAGLVATWGGAPFARADLPAAAGTPLRAFGHVFVRWRRLGLPETGVDLTGFAPPGSGDMFGRVRSEPLASGVPVVYLLEGGLSDP